MAKSRSEKSKSVSSKAPSEDLHSNDVHIVSIDAGNGMTNAILAKPKGGYKRVNFPSVRAAATGDSLGIGKQFEISYDYVDWGSAPLYVWR